jgi:hypothetical protein
MLQVLDNGQRLLHPRAVEWAELLHNSILRGRQLSPTFLRSVQRILPVVAQYTELRLTILDLDGRYFFSQVLLQVPAYKQRVLLETLQCLVCEWSGLTAEPLGSDNYLGLPLDLQNKLRQQALTLPLLPFPGCGAKLPRHPIWVAYY